VVPGDYMGVDLCFGFDGTTFAAAWAAGGGGADQARVREALVFLDRDRTICGMAMAILDGWKVGASNGAGRDVLVGL